MPARSAARYRAFVEMKPTSCKELKHSTLVLGSTFLTGRNETYFLQGIETATSNEYLDVASKVEMKPTSCKELKP